MQACRQLTIRASRYTQAYLDTERQRFRVRVAEIVVCTPTIKHPKHNITAYSQMTMMMMTTTTSTTTTTTTMVW